MPKLWKPRASSFAGYLYCSARAAYDKAIYLGDLTPQTGERDTKYADLGTIIHQTLQIELGCTFDVMPDPHPLEMVDSAAKLFHDSPQDLAAAVRNAVLAAKSVMPPAPDGKPWRAEVTAKHRLMSGHIDFLSADGTTIIDLKTTSRKPDHNRMKGEHFLQLAAYAFLVPTVIRAHILYVDSIGARWAMLSKPVDFTTEAAKDLLASIPSRIRQWRSKNGYIHAMATPGGHCSGGFCPHTAICKDALIPQAGPILDTTPNAVMPTVGDVL